MNDGIEAASWDVDFSSALRNRTGKYHVGMDVISALGPRVRQLRYGRFVCDTPPEGWRRVFVEKTARAELTLRRRWQGLGGRLRPDRPVIHVDPYTAVHYRLAPQDVVICHDMGPITHPELFASQAVRLYREAYERVAASRCTVVCVSAASRDAYREAFGAQNATPVIYNPLRMNLTQAHGEAVAGLPERFMLCVGSLGRRKNQGAVLRAYARSGLAKDGVGMVLCGPKEPGAEEVEALAADCPGVTQLAFVNDAQLRWLYAHAEGFVLMSLLEGFGVPVAEAMAAGVIPLVSTASVLEEVAGPGAISADPLDESDIARGLIELARMPETERDRRRAAFPQALSRFEPDRISQEWRTLADRLAASQAQAISVSKRA